MSVRKRVSQSRFESPAQEAMVSLLVAAGHVARALDDVCAAHGITHEQYNVLRILRGAHPEGHPRYAISERLIDRAPDVTRLLDRLQRAKLVTRGRSKEDRRLSVSRVTDRGLALLQAIDPEILAVHERFADGLSEREVTQLLALCDRVGGDDPDEQQSTPAAS